MRFSHLAAALCLISPVAAAQTLVVFQEEPLWDATGKWTRTADGSWTEDAPSVRAYTGKADKLDKDCTKFEFKRAREAIDAGVYVAVFRYAKTIDQNGAAPITFSVNGGTTGNPSVVVPVATQTSKSMRQDSSGNWIFWNSQSLIFSLRARAPVEFKIENQDTSIKKANYMFDSFTLGKIPYGKVSIYESMQDWWRGVWLGSQHLSRDFQDSDSAFSRVASIPTTGSNLWWFEWGWRTHEFLRPGTYTANVVLNKTGMAGAVDINWEVQEFDTATQAWKSVQKTVVPTTLQTSNIGKYIPSNDLVFRVRIPRSRFRFRLWHTCCQPKQQLSIDAFMVRRGSYEEFGKACNSNLGPVTLDGQPPLTGQLFEASVSNVPAVAVFAFGLQETSLDLTAAGAPMCTLYSAPLLTLGVAALNNVATLRFPIPTGTSFIGVNWLNQALVPDPQANALGLAFSNGARAIVQE